MLNIDDIMLYRTYDDVAERTSTMLSVYHNPSEGEVVVEGTGKLIVTNVFGQQMPNRDIDKQTTLNLPFGLYFIRLENKEGVSVSKFVVK